MHNIAKNVHRITALLKEIRIDSKKNADEIKLLAVSKGQSAEKLREAWQGGIRCFGENYLQEALPKIQALEDLAPEWHFLGPIQSNKARDIARYFQWVHTIDRLRIAERLSKHRQGCKTPLDICIQVNIDNEPNKAGVCPDQTLALACAVVKLPNLRLRGLMVLPKRGRGQTAQTQAFRRTARLLNELKNKVPVLKNLDTLSMGMTADVTPAVREGATIVRIGTGIFGSRDQPVAPLK